MDTSQYARCLFDRYHKTPMPGFPALTDADLDGLYSYIAYKSKILDSNSAIDYKRSFDSCAVYNRYMDSLQQARQGLIAHNGKQVRTSWVDSNGNPETSYHTGRSVSNPVVVAERQAAYYTFTIDTFGWSNIDLLLEESNGIAKSELRVSVTDAYKQDVNVLIVIPAIKAFQRCGLLKDKDDEYGFYTDDGMIYLPQDVEGYILIMSDYKGQVAFAKQQWTISKNATKIKETDKAIERGQQLKPANCDCRCGLDSDSAEMK